MTVIEIVTVALILVGLLAVVLWAYARVADS